MYGQSELPPDGGNRIMRTESTPVDTRGNPPRNRKWHDVSQDTNMLALVKGSERYVFLYTESNRAETLRTLGRFASNPELSFSWYDAAVLSQKIRQESIKATQPQSVSHAPPAVSRRYNLPISGEIDNFWHILSYLLKHITIPYNAIELTFP